MEKDLGVLPSAQKEFGIAVPIRIELGEGTFQFIADAAIDGVDCVFFVALDFG